MKLTLEQLIEILAKTNDLFDLYYEIGEYKIAKKYADMGERIIKAIFNPVNQLR